jgi:hypothetical protein
MCPRNKSEGLEKRIENNELDFTQLRTQVGDNKDDMVSAWRHVASLPCD